MQLIMQHSLIKYDRILTAQNLIHGMSQNRILGLKITFSLEMFFSFVRNNVCGL